MADINWGNTRAPAQTPQQAPQQFWQQPPHPQDPAYGAQAYHAAPQGHGQGQGHPNYAAPHAQPAQVPPQMPPQMDHGQYQGTYQEQTGANGYAPMSNPTAAGGHMPPRFGVLANYAGAAVSLALVAGLAVWGYQLAVRDVSGIPVVRALEGPMRVQPADPGGFAAAHQGLAVNTVQSSGQASAPSNRVALAPAPETLEAEDQPADPALVTTGQSANQPPALDPIEVSMDTPVSAGDVAAVDPLKLSKDPVAAALAIAEQISKNTQPLSEQGADVTRISVPSPSVAPLAVGPKIIAASVPGVRHSPRPLVRPAGMTMVARPAATLIQAVATAPREVSAEAIPAGTRLVQLGAFDSEDVARTEWGKLSDRFDEYIPGKTRVIQKAKSGGKTFYRLRAMGFKDLADARRFCSALMAGKAACIPVVTR